MMILILNKMRFPQQRLGRKTGCSHGADLGALHPVTWDGRWVPVKGTRLCSPRYLSLGEALQNGKWGKTLNPTAGAAPPAPAPSQDMLRRTQRKRHDCQRVTLKSTFSSALELIMDPDKDSPLLGQALSQHFCCQGDIHTEWYSQKLAEGYQVW